MKITNPTDDQLNAAFAEKVAGWFNVTVNEFNGARLVGTKLDGPINGVLHANPLFGIPEFTQSADAVLPWLQKTNRWDSVSVVDETQVNAYVTQRTGKKFRGTAIGSGRSNDFPRAACIALLRAHGVEVEFTQ